MLHNLYDIRDIFTKRFIIEPHLQMEQETTQYQRCACISTTSCWGATVLWRCLFYFDTEAFIIKTDIFILTKKKPFKFSPFLYMAMHRPPLPAVEERLIHRSSCPTRFVLGPLLLPIPVTEKYSRTMFQTLTSGAMCPRSVLETCTPLTVWTFRR